MRCWWWCAWLVGFVQACGSVEPNGAPVLEAGAKETGAVCADAHAGECCGCLCRDEAWSCTSDTCFDACAIEPKLAAEAGFFSVEAGTDLPARVFYAFHPADEAPDEKPLVMFSQGGPGASVAVLLGGNTAPHTLDPARTDHGKIAPNPHSWTSFANLLYVESGGAGYSYRLNQGDRAAVFDPDADAARFTRVLLRFLVRHPQLTDNPVILAGESYAGVRTTLMLRQLLNPAFLRDKRYPYRDTKLADEIEAYHQARSSKPTTEADRALQFGHQVLIQPAWLGDSQFRDMQALDPEPPGCAVSVPPPACSQELEQRFSELYRRVRDPVVLRQLLGVEIASLTFMGAQARQGASRRAGSAAHAAGVITASDLGEQGLVALFGALPEDGAYFAEWDPEASHVRASSTEARSRFGDTTNSPILPMVLENLRHVRTFVTDAGSDRVVRAEAMLATLRKGWGLIERAELIEEPEDRRITLTLSSQERVSIRFPHYPTAGHAVSYYAPDELLRDVRAWYEKR